MLKKMFLAGAKNLEVKKEWINELNVFPVPDGDTGTNMTLTIMSAVKEVNGFPKSRQTHWQKQFHPVLCVVREEIPESFYHSCSEVLQKGIRDYKKLDALILQLPLKRVWRQRTRRS